MRKAKLAQFIIIVAVIYALLKAPGVFLGKPIPESLIFMYMVLIVATVLLVMTSTDESAEELFRPIRALVEDPKKAFARNIVFAIAPLIAGYIAYGLASRGIEPPAELRSIHPAPPLRMTAYGKRIDMATLENPFRRTEKGDKVTFNAYVAEGAGIYFKNCVFCHGGKLDGRGHYAHALLPRPLPFKGNDTIAQLSESYVFWRVVKGGPGLPSEGGPANSSMPAWEDKLTEEEVWKVVLFLYDFTGNRPRESARERK